MNDKSKVDFSMFDYVSIHQSNSIEVNLAYGLYQCFDPCSGTRKQCLNMYGYNKRTQKATSVIPLKIVHEGDTMWLSRYTYKGLKQAEMNGDLDCGVMINGEFWSEVSPEKQQRGSIR